jgi:hypothetical protein
MEVTNKDWSESRGVIGHVLKFGLLVLQVRAQPGQSPEPAGWQRALQWDR